MQRAIVDYYQDEEQHWVAVLDCGHPQHVRHNPPWQNRPWVIADAGRREHLGTKLDCVRCDRGELPDGFVPYKRTATFDRDTLPAGLRSQHTLKAGVWGKLHMLRGRLVYRVHEPQPHERIIEAGTVAFIPPQVAHEVEPMGEVSFYIEFHRRQPATINNQ